VEKILTARLKLDRLGCRLRPAGVYGEHDTHRLHAMAPGLVGQTVERARDMQRMQPPQPVVSQPLPRELWTLSRGRLDSRSLVLW
jgi:hypothetical protein